MNSLTLYFSTRVATSTLNYSMLEKINFIGDLEEQNNRREREPKVQVMRNLMSKVHVVDSSPLRSSLK